MSDETERLIEDIRKRTRSITSFRATYRSAATLLGFPWEAEGTLSYQHPSSFRSEGTSNGQRFISVSNGETAQWLFADQKLLWTYKISEIKLPVYFSMGFNDIKDPFGAVDVGSIRYQGERVLGGRATHSFSGTTRNDFDIQRTAISWPVEVDLAVDAETGLLLRLSGSKGATSLLFEKRYAINDLNRPLDDALFHLETTEIGVRIADITDMVKASLFPHDSQGASMN